MAAQLPVFTRGTGPDSIASYDWLDLTAGVGYKRFYPCISTDSTGAKYFLSSKLIDADPNKTPTNTIANAAFALEHDIDFDITMGTPSIITGTAFLNIMTRFFSGGGQTNKYYYVINVYHATTAPTEVSIGTVQGGTTTLVGGPTTSYYRECLTIPLSYRKFAIGDILRLNVQTWAEKTVGAGGQISFFADPTTRVTYVEVSTGGTSGTDITFDVPFKIDLT